MKVFRTILIGIVIIILITAIGDYTGMRESQLLFWASTIVYIVGYLRLSHEEKAKNRKLRNVAIISLVIAITGSGLIYFFD